MGGSCIVRVSDIRLLVVFSAVLKIMVAHFVCILYTGFLIYTAQPGSSKLYWLSFRNAKCGDQ